MLDLFTKVGTCLMSASFLTDVISTFHTHIHTVRVVSVSNILTTEAMLKSCTLIQCGNGFILSMASLLRANTLPTGSGLRRHIFFNCCASLCQDHCLSFFFPSLSVCHPFIFLPLKAACRALADESDYLIWLRLNEMCVYVCSSTYVGAWFSCSVNFGELIWFMTYLLSKRGTDI